MQRHNISFLKWPSFAYTHSNRKNCRLQRDSNSDRLSKSSECWPLPPLPSIPYCSLQRDSNSDCLSKSRECWPLDHYHHCPYCLLRPFVSHCEAWKQKYPNNVYSLCWVVVLVVYVLTNSVTLLGNFALSLFCNLGKFTLPNRVLGDFALPKCAFGQLCSAELRNCTTMHYVKNRPIKLHFLVWSNASSPVWQIKLLGNFLGPWWWSSGQRARLLLQRSEFESDWSILFFC